MTIPVLAMPMLMIPENAPFTAEQRAWLSGLFASALAPHVALDESDARIAPPAPAGPELADNDAAPWHDPATPLDHRMKLAEGRALAPRLMAAMAQQDCGQCGYNCADYANALFTEREKRLNLCAPGGKDTGRMLKQLASEIGGAGGAVVSSASDGPQPSASAVDASLLGFCREQPIEATIVGRRRLNEVGSEKETWHVDFDLSASGIDYTVGDSFGVYAGNDLGYVDQIIAMLGASPSFKIRDKTLRETLRDDVSLGAAPDALFELVSYVTGGGERAKARALARGEDPDGDAATLDVMAAIHKFASTRLHPEAFVEALEPLQPRLYSISSSPKHTRNQLSLTVDAVRYVVGKRRRLGVASTFLADRVALGTCVRAYLQKAHNFALPVDPSQSVIMVGPGTGVAPFRAFLQERQAIGATGKNWLFFGHQRQQTDFFYRDEFESLRQAKILTRLSLAWSRDTAEKFYVQDRMREAGEAVWQWLSEGSYFYICGDAKRMAKDVETALVDIAAKHGGRSIEQAVDFVRDLKKSGRFQADVY